MVDLDEIEAKWLKQCGPCDYGMPEYGCTHPSEDYRPVIAGLVREVRNLTAMTRPSPLGYVWRHPMTGTESLLHPDDVTVVYPDYGRDET